MERQKWRQRQQGDRSEAKGHRVTRRQEQSPAGHLKATANEATRVGIIGFINRDQDYRCPGNSYMQQATSYPPKASIILESSAKR